MGGGVMGGGRGGKRQLNNDPFLGIRKVIGNAVQCNEYRSVAQSGGAFGLGPKGQRFKSSRSDQSCQRGAMVDAGDLKSPCCEFESHRWHQSGT